VDLDELGAVLGLDAHGVEQLRAAFGDAWDLGLRELARREANLSFRLLAGTFSQYQRAAQRWWGEIEPIYLQESTPRRRPVYFVSSNTHSLSNLLGGYAL